jgi:predicted nucleic acid-binding protein
MAICSQLFPILRTGRAFAALNEAKEFESWFDAFELSSDEEKELYVDYATQLDDGEAMSLALVHSRGFSMASDDRKARRLFTEEIGDLKRLLSTSRILKEWSEKAGMNTADVKQVLTDVSRRGRFFPNSGDTHFDWWSKAIV